MSDSAYRSGSSDAVIVGGGIIGLAIGYRLQRAGLSVTVVERDRAGAAASSAAAGMLAPNAEAAPGDDGFLELARAGLSLWPDFAGELQEVTGLDLELRTDGILMAARSEEEAAGLQAGLERRRRAGTPVEWLAAADLAEFEPVLSDSAGALYFPRDGQVNNRRACAALARAFRQAGGVLLEATPVHGLLLDKGRAAGVRSDAGDIAGGTTILAAGAWAGSFPEWPAAARPPVHPVKGQMAAIRPQRTLFDKVIWSVPGPHGVYLVPRADGRVIVGATVENAGFDTRLTVAGLSGLLASAQRVVPGLADAEIVDHWAGLRPGSPDDAPVVGESPIEGLVWATGHHRNGILLAPLTADAVCRLVMKEHWPRPYTVMSPGRQALSAVNAVPGTRQAASS